MPTSRTRASDEQTQASETHTRASEEQLAAYRRKRRFARTPEPAGDVAAETTDGDRRFVVQRHRARRLHYDFRLEVDGVLVSWAVPKGPTLDSGVRRAAFHVEDHPLEYVDFEGVIPSGEYGGGDVIVWDAGTWRPYSSQGTADPGRALADGELHFDLEGTKLRGRFLLVRTRTDADGKQQWLLKHKHDEYASEGWDAEDHPRSVLSGRTNEEVRADPDRVWRSDLPPDQAAVALKPGAAEAAGADELRALDDLRASGTWSVFGRELRVTNLDKEMFPGRGDEPPITKRELLAYAARVAPTVLPYLMGRALNLHRFPSGANTRGFWQKELSTHAPDWLPRWQNPDAKAGETQTYLVVDSPAALIWAVNFGGLEWHPWASRTDRPDRPTYALIDLDPGDATDWADLLVLARLHRTAFEHLGVSARPKLTGRRGIQIWVPIAAGPSFDETRAWVEALSRSVGAVVPELVSWQWQRGDRGGRARLDYTQNAINKTLVAPYSPRAAAGGPVSMPIEWADLDDPHLRPDGFTIRTVAERLADRGDVFRPVLDQSQHLPDLR